jgi:MtN3 and saliva related transmembrane protein
MADPLVQILGFVAGTLTTVAFAPQVLRTWRTGGQDLSWSMLTLFGTGVCLWLVYGALLRIQPILVANGLTFVQIAAIVAIKWRRGRAADGDATQTEPLPQPRTH